VDPHDLANPHDNEYLCYPCAEVTPNHLINPGGPSRFKEGMQAGVLVLVAVELAVLLLWWWMRKG